MMNIYMYPIGDPNKSATKNPYIDNLIEAFEKKDCFIVNKGKINKFGVLELLLYLPKVDTYYLNWIENLPDRRFGWIQAILFFIIFFILKLFKKRIIWMMHNKLSHSKKNLLLKIITNYFLVNNADIILTHSKDGIRFANSFLKQEKIVYFEHHPVSQNIKMIKTHNKKDIDILIWGAISPYKGIDQFLKYLKEHNLDKKYTIHIVGKITSENLEKELKKYINNQIVIENDFASHKKLIELHSRAKIVLFTYAGYSTLSSASLIDSLSYGNFVIGPDVGAFRDLKEEGIIETFIDFQNLIEKVDNQLKKENKNHQKLVTFIKENSWNKFIEKVCNTLSSGNKTCS